MGVSADGSNKAFASADVDRLLDRPRQAIPIDYHMPGGPSAFGTSHFILAVDPCGGGASAFAITSMAQVHTGHLLVRSRLHCLYRCFLCLRSRWQQWPVAQPLTRPHFREDGG